VSLIGWARELPAYEVWEALPGPRDVCYSLDMDNEQTTAVSAQATVEIAQNAVNGLIEAFNEQYESGAIDCAQDASRWLEAYRAGVMAVRF
jgi:hypothetical protein